MHKVKFIFCFLLSWSYSLSFFSQNFDNKNIKSWADFKEAKQILRAKEKNSHLERDLLKYFSSYDMAIEYAIKAIDWATKKGDTSEIIEAKKTLLSLYCTISLHSKSIALCKELLSYPEVNASKASVEVLHNLKEAYRKTEKFNELLKILPRYYKISKKFGNVVSGGNIYDIEVAYVYYRLNNYKKAIEFYKKSTQKLNQKKLYLLEGSSFNNIGICFRNIKQKDSANYYFNRGLNVLKRLQSDFDYKDQYVNYFKNVIETNVAETSSKKISPQKMISLYKKELEGAKYHNEMNIVLDSYYDLSKFFLKQKDVEQALKYLDSAEVGLQTYIYPKTKFNVLKLKIEAYLLKGDSKKANTYFKIYNRYSDSLNKTKVNLSFMNGVVKYETHIKEKELGEAKKLIESEGRIILYQRIGIFGLFSVFVFLVFIFFRIRKDNATIRQQKKVVDKALTENKTLVKEVHHRVKNNLQVVTSLLLIHSKKDKGFNSKEILKQTQNQIESMSLVHEMLYQKEDIINIPMQKYLKKLCSSLLVSYTKKKIKVTVLANNVSSHLDYANPIGLIINELVTNSIKHGFKDIDTGEITIKMSKTKNVYQLIYSDNGVGINVDELTLKNSKTFGSRLIRSLAEEINATIKIVNDNKLTYRFTFLDKKQSET